MDYFKYTFNEDEWNIYLIEDDDNDISDEDAAAEVKFENREIYFRKNALSVNTVKHELWHVYMGYCYLSDATELSPHSMEEISASLYADKGDIMSRRATEIYEKLKSLKDK